MKAAVKLHKIFFALLLLFLFGTKVIPSSVLRDRLLQIEKAETEEKGSSDASVKYKDDLACTFASAAPPLLILSIESFVSDRRNVFLPNRYFSIPTPPPWCRGCVFNTCFYPAIAG